jgi:hypothetical protein
MGPLPAEGARPTLPGGGEILIVVFKRYGGAAADKKGILKTAWEAGDAGGVLELEGLWSHLHIRLSRNQLERPLHSRRKVVDIYL